MAADSEAVAEGDGPPMPTETTPAPAAPVSLRQGMDLELACELVACLVGDSPGGGVGARDGDVDAEGDGDRRRAGGAGGGGGRERRAVSASCTESARASLQQPVRDTVKSHIA